jgi:hypothetical protein
VQPQQWNQDYAHQVRNFLLFIGILSNIVPAHCDA